MTDHAKRALYIHEADGSTPYEDTLTSHRLRCIPPRVGGAAPPGGARGPGHDPRVRPARPARRDPGPRYPDGRPGPGPAAGRGGGAFPAGRLGGRPCQRLRGRLSRGDRVDLDGASQLCAGPSLETALARWRSSIGPSGGWRGAPALLRGRGRLARALRPRHGAQSTRPARAPQARLRRPALARRPAHHRSVARLTRRRIRWSTPSSMRQLRATGFDPQPGTDDRRLVWGRGFCCSTGRTARRSSCATWWTATWPRTNGGWQWTASTGTDSAAVVPRLRSDLLLGKRRFDADGACVHSWVRDCAGVADGAIRERPALDPAAQAAARVRIGTETARANS